MIGKGSLPIRFNDFPPVLISATFLLTIYLLFIGEGTIAIIFASYGVILLQSRLPLWRLIRGFPGARALRRLIRSLFFFLPFPFLGPPILQSMLGGVLAGLIYGCFLLLVRLPELKFNLSKELITLLPPLSREDKFREMFHPILGAVAQEYFYRGVMLYILKTEIGVWAILVATIFFALEHVVHFNASEVFDKQDYLLQIILGLGMGIIFYFSESLVGCMLGHAVYNAPGTIQAMYRSNKE